MFRIRSAIDVRASGSKASFFATATVTRARRVIEGAEPQITGEGLLMLGDRRLPFAVEFDQPRIKPQLRRAKENQFLEGLLREAIEEPDAKPSR
jgi:hypothetical protein